MNCKYTRGNTFAIQRIPIIKLTLCEENKKKYNAFVWAKGNLNWNALAALL